MSRIPESAPLVRHKCHDADVGKERSGQAFWFYALSNILQQGVSHHSFTFRFVPDPMVEKHVTGDTTSCQKFSVSEIQTLTKRVDVERLW